MFEPGTRNELMRGRATISMQAYDMSKQQQEPDFDPIEYNFAFPRTNPVPVDEEPKSTFRQTSGQHLHFLFSEPVPNTEVRIRASILPRWHTACTVYAIVPAGQMQFPPNWQALLPSPMSGMLVDLMEARDVVDEHLSTGELE